MRGNKVDREILISSQMLKAWDMIHPSFPNETISTYVHNLKHVKLDKNKVPSISKGNKGCTKLWHKILKKYSDVFMD